MCRTSRAGTGPGGDIRRTRVQAAKDRMHAMRIWRESGTAPPAIVGSRTPYRMCQTGRDRYRHGPWNNAGTADRARPAMVGWEGPCPRGPSNISCTEDCAAPGGRSPAQFFQ